MKIVKIPLDEVLLIRQIVLWPMKDLEFVKTPDDNKGIHFGIQIKGRFVSCISLFIQENDQAVFRKFATLNDFQGKGYGSELLQYSFLFLKQQGIKKVSCSARLEKQRFYENLGMNAVGNPYLKNGLNYIKMEINF